MQWQIEQCKLETFSGSLQLESVLRDFQVFKSDLLKIKTWVSSFILSFKLAVAFAYSYTTLPLSHLGRKTQLSTLRGLLEVTGHHLKKVQQELGCVFGIFIQGRQRFKLDNEREVTLFVWFCLSDCKKTTTTTMNGFKRSCKSRHGHSSNAWENTGLHEKQIMLPRTSEHPPSTSSEFGRLDVAEGLLHAHMKSKRRWRELLFKRMLWLILTYIVSFWFCTSYSAGRCSLLQTIECSTSEFECTPFSIANSTLDLSPLLRFVLIFIIIGYGQHQWMRNVSFMFCFILIALLGM